MLMVIFLLLGLDIHLNTQTCSREQNGFKVLWESTLVSYFIKKVLVSDTKNVFNWEILFWKFIVSSGVTCFFKMTWLFNLTNILRSCWFFLTFSLLKFWQNIFLDDFCFIFIEKLQIIVDIRVILPHDDRFFLSTDTDEIFSIFLSRIELHCCDGIRMALILAENGICDTWIVE